MYRSILLVVWVEVLNFFIFFRLRVIVKERVIFLKENVKFCCKVLFF